MIDLLLYLYIFGLSGWFMVIVLLMVLFSKRLIIINLKSDLTCILFTILLMLVFFAIAISAVNFLFNFFN